MSILLWVLGTSSIEEIARANSNQDIGLQSAGANLKWKGSNEYFSVADFPPASCHPSEDLLASKSAPRSATVAECLQSEGESAEQFLQRVLQQQQQQERSFQFEYPQDEGTQAQSGSHDWDFHVAITPPQSEYYSKNSSLTSASISIDTGTSASVSGTSGGI